MPSPLTKLKTPCGTPTLSKISAKMIAANGVSSEGLSTTVLPAANAPANLIAVWFVGKFHGVIKPATPIASFITTLLPRRSWNWKSSNASRAALK